jgi:hypothetical protein
MPSGREAGLAGEMGGRAGGGYEPLQEPSGWDGGNKKSTRILTRCSHEG